MYPYCHGASAHAHEVHFSLFCSTSNWSPVQFARLDAMGVLWIPEIAVRWMLKPMNCPGHFVMFDARVRSYKVPGSSCGWWMATDSVLKGLAKAASYGVNASEHQTTTEGLGKGDISHWEI